MTYLIWVVILYIEYLDRNFIKINVYSNNIFKYTNIHQFQGLEKWEIDCEITVSVNENPK